MSAGGTTWRKRPEAEGEAVNTAAAAAALMLAQPAIIKRPLLCAADGSMLLGFNEDNYQTFIQEKS